ncbi:ABC transporter permease [Paenibacillus tengchongensis]|uniref:ABC transporter permease n=1 Tax=Paenibacillus tengchongensis TaxID=2608684 RepID=UPI00124D6357|nr:ABC-2 family transporter protein [Paenibacillus tengchongensis]
MFKTIKHRFQVMRAVAFVTFKEWSAYRSHSMVSIFVGPVYFLVQYYIWTSVYSGEPSINGMSLPQMLTYFCATLLVNYLTMDFADWNLQMLIRTGKFITFSLRPVNHMFFALSQKVGHRVLGLLFECIPCFLIFYLVFDINVLPANAFYAVLSIAMAFLMNFFINYSIGMTAFWMVQSSSIRNIFNLCAQVFSGAAIPLVFFPRPLQVASFFLPFQYTAFVPAMVYTGSYTLADITLTIPQVLLLQLLAVIVAGAVCRLLYAVSLKHFTGVGA